MNTYLLHFVNAKRYYIFSKKIRILSCFFGGGGEETRPPVGKNINRPKNPYSSAPSPLRQGLHVILAW